MSDTNPRSDLAGWFNLIIDGLYRFVAAHGGLHRNRRDVPLVVLLCNYLRRVARRFAALVARGGAPARPGGLGPRPSSGTPPSPRPRFPLGWAWLLPIVPLVGNFGGQLHVLLASEEFAALLAAGPAAGRLMRPLCRMLNIGPEHPDLPRALFHIPPRPVKLRPAKPRPAKSRPEAAQSQAANVSAAAAPPLCSPPPDALRADRPIPDPPPELPPEQA